MTTPTYYLLDTFTREKFKGNPTPVCVLPQALSAETMHSLAIEFQAPVSVFIEPSTDFLLFPIRYFTITGEIPACGHGTLGAAVVLLEELKKTEVRFKTIENTLLKARKEEDLTFLTYPKLEKTNIEIPESLVMALGITHTKTHFYCETLESLFLEVPDENEVIGLKPDYEALSKSMPQIKEVVVMCQSADPQYDFVLRSFCPWIGINEDPVTGSIHSVLGHFWKERLGKNTLIAYQASQRGGHLLIRPLENSVEIGGYAKKLIEGKLIVK